MLVLLRRCCHFRPLARHGSTTVSTTVETDAQGIPLRPTWSVHELISSYPTPKLSDETFNRLHSVAALIPPIDSQKHANAKKELEELVKLVEAVKLVDTAGVEVMNWSDHVDLHQSASAVLNDGPTGQELLAYAKRTKDGLYVVDTAKPRCALHIYSGRHAFIEFLHLDDYSTIVISFTSRRDHPLSQSRRPRE